MRPPRSRRTLADKWEVSADGKVWTLHLRKGVKFHDGEPCDAAAVVWNIERWWKEKHPQHENQVKAGQTFEYWEGQFDGFDDKSIVSKVEAVGTRHRPGDPQAAAGAVPREPRDLQLRHRQPEGRREVGRRVRQAPGGHRRRSSSSSGSRTRRSSSRRTPTTGARRPRSSGSSSATSRTTPQRLAALKAGEIHGMEGLNSGRRQGGARPTRISSSCAARRTTSATWPSTTT